MNGQQTVREEKEREEGKERGSKRGKELTNIGKESER